jgi:hypothetical protein
MRSINSPGVQITERDFSATQVVAAGTNVFVTGFAAEGPTDVVLDITSVPELENIYGKPTTPAERYFNHTCRQVLNSRGNLLTSRLPYGTESGTVDAALQYSALLYPVLSANNTFKLGAPTHLSLNEDEYRSIMEGNYTWAGAYTATGTSTTTTSVVSTLAVNSTLSAAKLAEIATIDSTFTVDFTTPGFATFTFDQPVTTTFATGDVNFKYDTTTKTSSITGGFIIVNKAQTIVDHTYSGFYVSLTDNERIGPSTDFDSINAIYSLTGTNEFYSIPDVKLAFPLTAPYNNPKDSISEIVERTQSYFFGDDYYRDSVLLNVFKLYRSNNEPQKLSMYLAETHAGSFDQTKRELSITGAGKVRSFYLEDTVNVNSSNIKILINPEVSFRVDWTSKESNTPPLKVRVEPEAQAAFALGVYMPTYLEVVNKRLGNIPAKLIRSLELIQTTETTQVDIIPDAGLSTINAWVDPITELYDDETRRDVLDINTAIDTGWRTIYNIFNNFVTNTRKDCVFISDPLRNIFVNGVVKTMGVKGSQFTTAIYTPLKRSYIDSSSSYCTTYGNWVKILDPATDKYTWTPFSGFAAAIYCNTDASGHPWDAPAGLNRGVVTNINDIAFNPNQKQRDYLYTIAVNPVVYFTGDGYTVYGQKTLQTKPSAFDRLNVRRLFLALERATVSVAKYFVFEPNTEITRSRFRNTLTPIFELAKQTQGLYDYLIVCDDRNNTPANIDSNELVVDIYIKPVRTAEFILINFIATRTSQNFQELI